MLELILVCDRQACHLGMSTAVIAQKVQVINAVAGVCHRVPAVFSGLHPAWESTEAS